MPFNVDSTLLPAPIMVAKDMEMGLLAAIKGSAY
jgi:hypothetical protein